MQRLFAEQRGYPFTRWRTRARLNTAASRPRAGYGLSEAARASGYLTRSALTRALSRKTGLPESRLAVEPLAALDRVQAPTAFEDPDAAADMLEGRGPVSGMDPAGRARHLTAVAEVAHARGDLPALKSAAAGLAEYARSTLEGAAADLTTARLRLMEGRPALALVSARRAHDALTGIGLPFEAAQARMPAGTARAEEGDPAGARQDWAQAREQFAAVGARADA